MHDYKSKKFQMQKELESVYYGLSERTLKTIKLGEEEFMQRTDELKNSVSAAFITLFLVKYFKTSIGRSNHRNSILLCQLGKQ